MLLKIFRGRNLFTLILAPILLIVLWIPSFLHPHLLANTSSQMPIYSALIALIGNNALVLNIVACILLVVLALLTVRINERYLFIRVKTDLPALLFVLIGSGTVVLIGMHPALLSLLFIFFAIEQAFAIYHGEQTIAKSFNVGLCIGLAGITYLFASIYLVWFWIALAFLGQFKAREFFAALVGFLVPLIVAFSLYYLYDSLDYLILDIKSILIDKINYNFDIVQKIYWAIMALFLLGATIFTLRINEEQNISSRKNLSILAVFLAFTVVAFLMTRASGIELYYFIIIPVTVFMSKYFVLSQYSWIMELFFTSFLLVNLLVHIL